ncbi:hypothetical protein E2542_SST04262 [Spatholobus suberectus]|nr:hypothetical protein E2542_SST04262 [Spatholobus suberectus]
MFCCCHDARERARLQQWLREPSSFLRLPFLSISFPNYLSTINFGNCRLNVALVSDATEEVKAMHEKITYADLYQGIARPERLGFDGPCAEDSLTFDNPYLM